MIIFCENTYRSQDQGNRMNRNRIKKVMEYDSLITFIFEPHCINCLLKDWMFVYSFSLALRIREYLTYIMLKKEETIKIQ